MGPRGGPSSSGRSPHDLAIIETDVLGSPVADPATAARRSWHRSARCTSPASPKRACRACAPASWSRRINSRRGRQPASGRRLDRHPARSPRSPTRWVEDGTAIELVRWQRAALRRRHAIAAEILHGLPHAAHPQACTSGCRWPRVGARISSSPTRACGAWRSPRARPSRRRRPPAPAVRISLGPIDEAELQVWPARSLRPTAASTRAGAARDLTPEIVTDLILSIDGILGRLSIRNCEAADGTSGQRRWRHADHRGRPGLEELRRSSRCSTSLSFTVAPGEKLALIGPSGSGKTTILRILMTLETINDGISGSKASRSGTCERNGALVPADERHLHKMRAKHRDGVSALQPVPAQDRA